MARPQRYGAWLRALGAEHAFQQLGQLVAVRGGDEREGAVGAGGLLVAGGVADHENLCLVEAALGGGGDVLGLRAELLAADGEDEVRDALGGPFVLQRSGGGLRADHHVGVGAGLLERFLHVGERRDALADAGLPIAPPVVGDWTSDYGYTFGQTYDFSDATAVFAANDQMALGLVHGLSERGLSVPGDISVVGFDDLPDARHFLPPLTTVRQDFAALGALALHVSDDAERLWQRLRLTNAEHERLGSMAQQWWRLDADLSDHAARALLYRLGPERFTDRTLFAWARADAAA